MRDKLELWLAAIDSSALFADGFDDAILGLTEVEEGWRVCYDIGRILEILVAEHGMDVDEAVEYYDFNIEGSYVGPLTPLFIQCVQ
jgi:hypothetical protein